LDWLTTEFVARGWSLKSMHRLIMTSYVYRMSSRFTDQGNLTVDKDNRYLWRANRRRLEAEAVWDAIHAAAGTLNLKMGGRPFVPPLSEAELTPWRAVYILSRRTFIFPMFDKFDTPDPAVSSPGREITTVAPQSLWLLNNPIVFRQAREFAARLVRENGEDPAAWVEQAWRIGLGRAPSGSEKKEALAMLASVSEKPQGRVHSSESEADSPGPEENPEEPPEALAGIDRAQAARLTELCLAIFNLNEFLFVD
jgi:hypothetical protein